MPSIPQVNTQLPGVAPPPIMTSDQILNHVDSVYNSLPDPVKGALDHAHSLTGGGGSGRGDALKPSASPAPIAPPPVEMVSSSTPSLTTANSAQSPHNATAIAPPPVGAASSITTAPAPSAAQGELSRLTAPPLASDNPLAHTKADTGRTGIGQIHNPFLRGLATVGDVIASGVFPRFGEFIPGTTAHHELLVNDAANAVGQEQKSAKNAADIEHTAAESELQKEQANHLRNTPNKTFESSPQGIFNTGTGEITSPATDKYIAVGDGLYNAATHSWEREPTDKKLLEVTEIDPEKGKALGLVPGKDGRYTIPNTALGELLKPPTAEKPTDQERFIQSYLKEHNLEDNATNRATALKAHAAAAQMPQRPPQVTVMVPNAEGGYTAQSVKAGDNVAPGAVTAGGMNSLNVPTAQTRTMAEVAPKVLDLANRVGTLIDQQEKSLGPAASRWNEFMAGKVGAPNPEFTKLRTDVGLLQTALMRMHVGARGGEQMMHHFQDLLDVAKQDPQNLKAALDEIREYAKSVQGNHQGTTNSDSSATGKELPGGITLDDIDKEIQRRKGARK